MSRKTTAYARRCRRNLVTNGAAWLDTMAACQPYTDEKLPGSWLTEGTQIAATRTKAVVRGCFDRLKAGTTPTSDTDDIDTLSHAMGVSCIRAGQTVEETPRPRSSSASVRWKVRAAATARPARIPRQPAARFQTGDSRGDSTTGTPASQADSTMRWLPLMAEKTWIRS